MHFLFIHIRISLWIRIAYMENANAKCVCVCALCLTSEICSANRKQDTCTTTNTSCMATAVKCTLPVGILSPVLTQTDALKRFLSSHTTVVTQICTDEFSLLYEVPGVFLGTCSRSSWVREADNSRQSKISTVSAIFK